MPAEGAGWGSPVWLDTYDPGLEFYSTGARVIWLDVNAMDRAVVVWLHTWDIDVGSGNGANGGRWEYHFEMRACVITKVGSSVSAGPITAWGHTTEWFPNWSQADACLIGDDYFVCSAAFNSNDWDIDTCFGEVYLCHVDGDTVVVDSTTQVDVNTNYTSYPRFGPTSDPNRVLMMYQSYTSSPYPHHLYTVDRSGSSLTITHRMSHTANGDPVLFVDADRVIGYFGGTEYISSSGGATGVIFTLDYTGVPTASATGAHGDIPAELVNGFWGPGYGEFVATWNDTYNGGGGWEVFDLVRVLINSSGMVVDERSGPFRGDEGWSSSINRWLPSAYWSAGNTIYVMPQAENNIDAEWETRKRPYLVQDPFFNQFYESGHLPYGGDWVPWDSTYWSWGIDLAAGPGGCLVAIHAPAYEDSDDDGAGSSMLAVVWVETVPPVSYDGGWVTGSIPIGGDVDTGGGET